MGHTVTYQQHLYIHTARATHRGATSWSPLPLPPSLPTYSLPQGSSAFQENQPTRPKSGQPGTPPHADHQLLSAVRVSGSRLLLSALQPGPAATTGDQSPSECSTAPRDNETTVPGPGAGNYHHRYYNLTGGAASLNRLLLRRQHFPLLGLKERGIFRQVNGRIAILPFAATSRRAFEKPQQRIRGWSERNRPHVIF